MICLYVIKHLIQKIGSKNINLNFKICYNIFDLEYRNDKKR